MHKKNTDIDQYSMIIYCLDADHESNLADYNFVDYNQLVYYNFVYCNKSTQKCLF